MEPTRSHLRPMAIVSRRPVLKAPFACGTQTAAGAKRLVINLGRRAGGRHPLAFSPDGKFLACATTKDIHLFDLIRGVKAGMIKNAHGEETLRVEFGPDGKTLFSAGESSAPHYSK
jgi:WD40 repeat protein